ncbi:MAG: helix-turn-helix transcriptional regulator [Streptomyces sp.]|uniref:TetR/AcrR family transcriptional regulator n=1 Tax=Streptomyces sp. TaxID=1931 RepID=UPI0025CC1434|nr:helix-turn-helix domain-containing protein [Streptomyces sp.]MBW8799036.1 helix-turn-helix transcriptional regulator [Streptomyces sp.]
MGDTYTGKPRGRQREADRNDARLFQAAREVFAERGWDAPVSEIARRAGIGMGSLYRRYPSKELLAQRMRIAGMEQLVTQARTAVAEESDPWAALVRFFRDALAEQGTGGPLLPLVGGRLPATDEVQAAARQLRAALESADIPLLLEHLTPQIPVTSERATALHLRYLDLVLAGLRAPDPGQPTALHGPGPQWAELRDLWNAPES